MADIYSIRSNGSVYYGSTRNDAEFRFAQHKRDLTRGKHRNTTLQNLHDAGAELRLHTVASGLSDVEAIELEDLILKTERGNPRCINKVFTAVYVLSNQSKVCEWNGRRFRSVAQAYAEIHPSCSLTQFKHYVQIGLKSCEEAVAFREKPSENYKPITWDGITYSSKKEALASGALPFVCGHSLNRCISEGINTTEAYKKARANKPKLQKHTVKMMWNGKECDSFNEAARGSKLSAPTIKKAVSKGYTSDEDYLKRREIVWRGVTYPSIAVASRELNLPYHTIYQALKS
jgi:predicted GIY-YIG superfamily endonuclease